jgi:hypothetical protein
MDLLKEFVIVAFDLRDFENECELDAEKDFFNQAYYLNHLMSGRFLFSWIFRNDDSSFCAPIEDRFEEISSRLVYLIKQTFGIGFSRKLFKTVRTLKQLEAKLMEARVALASFMEPDSASPNSTSVVNDSKSPSRFQSTALI